jgi:hypothetical protein
MSYNGNPSPLPVILIGQSIGYQQALSCDILTCHAIFTLLLLDPTECMYFGSKLKLFQVFQVESGTSENENFEMR